MSGVTVRFSDASDVCFGDGGGCEWCWQVANNGELFVFQVVDGSDTPAPERLAEYAYAPGVWSSVVLM